MVSRFGINPLMSVKKVIVLGTSRGTDAWERSNWIYRLLVGVTVLKHNQEFMDEMEKVYQQEQDLDICIVHPPHLVDEPFTGKAKLVETNNIFGRAKCPRADCAKWMVDEIHKEGDFECKSAIIRTDYD